MLVWALLFAILAVIFGVFGFYSAEGTAWAGARLLFWVWLILFIVSLVAGLFRRGTYR